MDAGVALDVPDVVVVDDGYVQANWPFLRQRLRAGLVKRELTVLWASLGKGQRIRDLYGIAAVPAVVVLDVEPDEADIAALSKLEVLAGVTGGAELAVADQLAARGIPFVDASRGRSRSRAEMAIGLMIAALRQIPTWHNVVTDGPANWPRPSWQYTDHPGYVNGTVCGKQVAVLGMDPTSRNVIALCAGLGAHVWAVDPHTDDTDFGELGAQRIQLDEVASVADVVVVAGDSSAPMLTSEMVERLPRGALVVTVSGAGVDMTALRRRVLADELMWSTDTYESVPVAAGDPILDRHNVVHTPGIGACTRDANLAVADILTENIARILSGGAPLPWDCIPAVAVDDESSRPAPSITADPLVRSDSGVEAQS
ncbi:NAD(P)-dependent oxidoreductase [Nocardia sp. CA-107356]|uniref:NAD(P)-dependent oxidoreductase n=1 Tax=Nocardia sp. CA-107356 TaxID=3239972 RepID=UPI003D911AF1